MHTRFVAAVLLASGLSASGAAAVYLFAGENAEPRSEKKNARGRMHGQRPNESLQKWKARRTQMIRRCSDRDPYGYFTLRGRPFITRTDISPDFTADTALYMEMLHRDYKKAYQKVGLPPGDAKELIEVIVFADRKTYLENGGSEGSGGYFRRAIGFPDRPANWPVRHYRLAMFTSGEHDFDKWEKGTLKHEAAHMELQLRLGFLTDCPRWWNEGQASVFEDWDFDLSVEENLAAIPRRGRYAPVIRRAYGTDKFKPFDYVWTIDPASWHSDMTSEQGALNYAQAWSLAAFMLHEGVNGRKAFMRIFKLSLTVGADREISTTGTKTRAWEQSFTRNDQRVMESQWTGWIEKNLPRKEANRDEWEGLLDMGYDPRHDEELVPLTPETRKELRRGRQGTAGPGSVSGSGGRPDKKKPPRQGE